MLTKETIQKVLPSNLKNVVTDNFVALVNNASQDPQLAEEIRNNFLSYTRVMQDGKYKTEDYLNAVTYVTHRLHECTAQEAYIKTFPQRYQALVAKGVSSKDLAAYVSGYAKGKLVNAIMEQTLIPLHVFNVDVRQKAINRLVELMMTSKSDKVAADSANSLLVHLAEPKLAAPAVNINIGENSMMADMKATIEGLAKAQLNFIKQGGSTREIAESTIIDVEAKNVTP